MNSYYDAETGFTDETIKHIMMASLANPKYIDDGLNAEQLCKIVNELQKQVMNAEYMLIIFKLIMVGDLTITLNEDGELEYSKLL